MIGGALTASELALLRTRPQRTLLYIAIPEYKTIYTARVNGTPTSNDNTHRIAFDGGAGVLTDIERNMTLMVGTTAGAWDIGLARIRRDGQLGDTYFYIGSTSELDLADDQYITIIDDIGLWPVHPYINASGTMYMDYDIAYANQNVKGPPVPIMGTHSVLELTGASVSATFDASGSYSAIGAPVTYDYLWYVDGVFAGNTASIDLTFTAVGTYLVKLIITANYSFCVSGQESISYRYVIVHDCEHPLNSSFTLDSCSGSFSGGGWSYHVTMNAKASQDYVRDRTLCMLVAEDWYGDTKDSIGLLSGRENIVCVGWVDGESVRRSNDKSMVSFDVQGPAFWLAVQEGFPTGIDDTTAAPVDWSHIQALDPQSGLFSFLHWRTTSTAVMDCWITDDDHRLATTYTPAGSLHEQLRAIAERVNAYTVCDRYGRLFCQIDTQFITPILRVFPVIQTLTDIDWRDEITIERRTVPPFSQVDLSGIYYSGNFATSSAIFSLSPGHYPKHHGHKHQVPRIALDDQAEANTQAGLWLGYLNNEYPHIDVPMSSNYRAIDIAPRMFAQMNLAAGDTPRELEWTNKKLIPREVSFNYDSRQAVLLTDITFEAETFASDAVTGDPPIEPPDPPIYTAPPPPAICNDPKALNFGGLEPCMYPELSGVVLVMTNDQLGVSQDFYTSASPSWTDCVNGALSGVLVDNFTMVALAPTNEAWLLTGIVGDNADANGLWYCSNIVAAAPSFGLILSHNGWSTLIGAAGNLITSLGCDTSGVAYVTGTGTVLNAYYAHGTNAMALAQLDPFPVVGHLPIATSQYSISSEAQVLISSGAGGVPAHGITAVTGGSAPWFYYDTPEQLEMDPANGFFRWFGGGQALYSYAAGFDAAVLVYAGVSLAGPVISDGTNCLTIRDADGFLMNGAAELADPLVAFGIAGRTFSGYAIGQSGFGEVIACATEGAANDFIVMRDTTGAWTTKDGDWVAVMGGNYSGRHGAAHGYPMIVTADM